MRVRDAETPPGRIEVIRATREQEPVLANLLELYVHDFSEFLELKPGPDGRFGYKNLPLYWIEPERHPFLITVNCELAGFALVKRGSQISNDDSVWDMAEFFVLRGYRRHGIGTKAAYEIWRSSPGRWEVRVMEVNSAAHGFWECAVGEFTGEPVSSVRVEKDGECWRLFSFESR
jgi:predicted acetyltransferase